MSWGIRSVPESEQSVQISILEHAPDSRTWLRRTFQGSVGCPIEPRASLPRSPARRTPCRGVPPPRGKPWLDLGAASLRWTPSAYIERKPPASRRRAVLITPQWSVTALRTRWGSVVRLLHPTALGSFAA